MNRMYNNSMDALNLYSERIAQDMSRFTGGARKGKKASAPAEEKTKAERLTELLQMQEILQKQARDAQSSLKALLAARKAQAAKAARQAPADKKARTRKGQNKLQIRRGYIESGVAGCKSGINNKDFDYLCDRIKPRKQKAAGLSGVGLSGLGYASGLSGLGYSRASGLSAAGLSGGRISRAKRAQMGRWSRYQDEINKLRNMGYAYRQAQQMAKHILRIN